MRDFALTPPQLLRQAVARALPPAELARLARACELAGRMAEGLYRAQGVPFLCHLVRTASIVLAEDEPIDTVIAALLHPAYRLHLFDPGRRTPRRREREEIESVAGREGDELLRAYAGTPFDCAVDVAAHLGALATRDARTRRVLLLCVANELEDLLDAAAPAEGEDAAASDERGRLTAELASRLGRPLLCAELHEAFSAARQAGSERSLLRGRRRAYAAPTRGFARRAPLVRGWKAVRRAALRRIGLTRAGAPSPVPLFDARQPLLELSDWRQDAALLGAVRACIESQRRAAENLFVRFRPDPRSAQLVSPEALAALESAGAAPSDIVEDRGLSNCIAFNFENVEQAVMDREVAALRKVVDGIVTGKLRALFGGYEVEAVNSGHFWYPPGSFMSWHQNLRTPGWRLYLSFAEEPGLSFFRYRCPRTGQIVTATDETWNFRLFEISAARPLWHAIHSQTHRFSIGYRVMPRLSPARRVERKLRRWVRALRGRS